MSYKYQEFQHVRAAKRLQQVKWRKSGDTFTAPIYPGVWEDLDTMGIVPQYQNGSNTFTVSGEKQLEWLAGWGISLKGHPAPDWKTGERHTWLRGDNPAATLDPDRDAALQDPLFGELVLANMSEKRTKGKIHFSLEAPGVIELWSEMAGVKRILRRTECETFPGKNKAGNNKKPAHIEVVVNAQDFDALLDFPADHVFATGPLNTVSAIPSQPDYTESPSRNGHTAAATTPAVTPKPRTPRKRTTRSTPSDNPGFRTALQHVMDRNHLSAAHISDMATALGDSISNGYVAMLGDGRRSPSATSSKSVSSIIVLTRALGYLCGDNITASEQEIIASAIGWGPEIFLPKEELVSHMIMNAYQEQKTDIRPLLRDLLAATGINAQDFADAVGVTRSAISKIFGQSQNYPSSITPLLDNALGLSAINPDLADMLADIANGERDLNLLRAASAISSGNQAEGRY